MSNLPPAAVPPVALKAPELPPVQPIVSPIQVPTLAFDGTMHEVQSGFCSAIGYESTGEAGTLAILYPTGKTYLYPDVPPEQFNSIAQATSVGSVARAVIKGRPFIQV